ncbi:MAG TPA: hypothetical protein VKU62_07985 [Thermoanaerobaculia bacterium]|nr:hypothetical protein [Thermoanaerobaculia bacterium]
MARKPILFVPGFPASELRDAATQATVFPPPLATLISKSKKAAFIERMTTVPGDLVAGPPIRDVLGIAKQAQSLYDILDKFGYDNFEPVGWDWRLGIADARVLDRVAAAVDRLGAGIVAIVHSTGGLVFRAFLEAHPDLTSRFEHVMAFGVPWRGTFEALRAISVGESAGLLFARLTASESREIMSHAQAAYDLLPQNARFAEQFDALPVTNVCGWGSDTWTSAQWTHSKDAGDGTVPLWSSSYITGANVRTFFLPIGAYAEANIPSPHPHIWDSPPVLQLFEEVLNDAPPAPFLCACADSDDYIDYGRDVDVRVSASVPDCKVTVDIDGTNVPLNPDGLGAFIVKREGIEHNVANDIYRFTVTFQWSGGSAKRAVSFKSP